MRLLVASLLSVTRGRGVILMKLITILIISIISICVMAKIDGYKVEKGEVILIDENGKSIDIIEPPNEKDKKTAEELDQELKDKIIKYINQPKSRYSIEACRKAGKILLIDCGCPDIDDGNIHVIYDIEKKQIIGFFSWYPQG